MAVPILRLNIDNNPRIIVKQDSIPVTITGYTQTIVQGSGATTVTESGVNPKIYTVYTPIGTAQWGSIIGDITTQTDLTDYVTQSISAATSGLTSSWNDLTDKPSWLSGATLEEFQTGHTHSYDDLTDLPTLFSGDYDDLTNKPDLSVYQPVSGMSAYLTGVTWNDVTNKPDLTLQADFTGHTSQVGSGSIHFTGHTFTASGITVITQTGDNINIYVPADAITGVTWGSITGTLSGQTDLSNALDSKLDNSVYQADMLIIGGEIDNLITTVSGHTGDTSIHTTMAQVNAAISAATSGLTSSWSGLTGQPTDNTDLVDYVTGQTALFVPINHTGTTYNSHIARNASGILDITGKLNTTGVYARLRVTSSGVSVSPYDASNLLRAGNYLDTAGGTFGYEDWDTIAHLLQIGAAGINVTSKIDYSDTIYYKSLADIESTFGDESLINRHYADLRYTLSGTTAALQSAINTYTGTTAPATYALKSLALTGGTNMGTTSLIHGTPVSGNKLQLKGLIAGSAKIVVSGGTTNNSINLGSVALDDLSDVVITSAAANQVLQYSGSSWQNVAATDIFTNVTDGDLLARNGTAITGVTQTKFALSAHTHSQYLTGFTVTCDMVTGCTDGLYSPIGHSHSFAEITGDVSGNTNLQNALDGKLDNSVYQADMLIIGGEIDSLISGQTALSASTLSLLHPTIINLTGSTTGDTSWDGAIVEMDSTGNTTLTLPNGLNAGATIRIYNVNTGDVTIAAEGTLQGVGTILATQYTKAEAYNRGGDVWLITGTLTS